MATVTRFNSTGIPIRSEIHWFPYSFRFC